MHEISPPIKAIGPMLLLSQVMGCPWEGPLRGGGGPHYSAFQGCALSRHSLVRAGCPNPATNPDGDGYEALLQERRHLDMTLSLSPVPP